MTGKALNGQPEHMRMMMSKEQPEALPVRLAKRLCDGISTGHDWPNTDDELLRMQSAAELRRLHAENEALRAQIGQGVPDGWQLVPKEPTLEMMDTFRRHDESALGPDFFGAYRALLASAPQAPQQIGQGVPDVDDLRVRLVAISSAIDDSDDIEAQAIIRTTLEMLASAPQAPQQQPLTTCNCRWDGETQVQQCTLHEAHIDAIHEWAERAKVAEAKLVDQQAKPQPLTDEQIAATYKRLTEKARQTGNPKFGSVLSLARAIEAAHNIGAKK